jgi:hypothetical protein
VEVVLALALLHVLAQPLEQTAAGHQLPDAVLHAARRHALLLPVQPQPVLLEPGKKKKKGWSLLIKIIM